MHTHPYLINTQHTIFLYVSIDSYYALLYNPHDAPYNISFSLYKFILFFLVISCCTSPLFL